MGLRVTQQGMYGSFISQMNTTLGSYMEANMQGSSQKRINKPSDDPAGMARVLNYRATLGEMEQYQRNVDTAQGWLGLTDKTLNQVSTVLISLKEKAEQAATDTLSPTNREQISYEMRQLFDQLISLSNTRFENNSIFGGHKQDQPAFAKGLNISTNDPNLQKISMGAGMDPVPIQWEVSGEAARTVMLRFPESGVIPPPASTPPNPPNTLDFEWSTDGGKTWNTKTLNEGENVVDMDGVKVTFPVGNPANPLQVTGYDKDKPDITDNGTMLYVRPTAIYQGDDNDMPPTIESFGTSNVGTVSAKGLYTSDVRVRFDETFDPNIGGTLKYSYSVDNGSTWINSKTDVPAGTTNMHLPLPGGYLDVEAGTDPLGTLSPIDSGQQFVIHPKRADLDYEISPNEYISVNNIGKDIFGGMYNGKPVYEGDGRNLFEVIGRLVGYTESNDAKGIAASLAEISTAQNTILTEAAAVGGKENRLKVTSEVLDSQTYDQSSRMSYLEDVNLSKLMISLTQSQIAYQTVLKSSSMIMQLRLTNFI